MREDGLTAPEPSSRVEYVERRSKSEFRRTLYDIITVTKDFPFRWRFPVMPEQMIPLANEAGQLATESAESLCGKAGADPSVFGIRIGSVDLDGTISAVMRGMERLAGRYYLLALCADDYVAGFPKQMERGLPR